MEAMRGCHLRRKENLWIASNDVCVPGEPAVADLCWKMGLTVRNTSKTLTRRQPEASVCDGHARNDMKPAAGG